MKSNCLPILFLAITFSSVAQTNCKLRKDQDSIRVYTCNTDTSKFKSILAEFSVNTTLPQLKDFLLNFPNYTTWQYNTIEAKEIKKINDSESIYYAKIEAPWPIEDRDMVVRFRIVSTKVHELTVTANSEKNIVAEKKGLIRVPSSHSQWLITEKGDNRLLIKYAIQIDPGGSVPAWLVNWVCANAPHQSFKAMKAILEKKK